MKVILITNSKNIIYLKTKLYYLNNLRDKFFFLNLTYYFITAYRNYLLFFKSLLASAFDLYITHKKRLKLSNVVLSSFVFNVSKSNNSLTIHRKDMKLKNMYYL